jgi:membrane protein DedA with SNARE-associated domain
MDALMANDKQYDRSTLIAAAVIFIGFGLVIYFLPNIMQAVGGENRWAAGAVVIAVLVLPFAGLWLRGRSRRKGK